MCLVKVCIACCERTSETVTQNRILKVAHYIRVDVDMAAVAPKLELAVSAAF